MNPNIQWSLKSLPLQVYKLPLKTSIRSFHILHQFFFEVLFFLFNETNVEIVVEKHIHLLNSLDPSFTLSLSLLLFPCGKMLVTFKILESSMRGSVVANSRSTIYVTSIVDKTSKSLKDDWNICH
jgi:hypothetical protein